MTPIFAQDVSVVGKFNIVRKPNGKKIVHDFRFIDTRRLSSEEMVKTHENIHWQKIFTASLDPFFLRQGSGIWTVPVRQEL